MMSRLKKHPWVIVLSIVVLLLLLPIVIHNPFLLHVMNLALIYGMLAVSWDILSGYTGQVSFGHAGFFAIGGYVASISSRDLGVSVIVGILLAGIITAILGFFVGFPALRLRGPYLAIVTLGVAEIIRLVATNWVSLTGGPYGVYGYPSFSFLSGDVYLDKLYVYYVVLLSLFAIAASLKYIGDFTRTGQTFKAIREDEILAATLGINVTNYKLLSFALSALVAGIAGAFYAYYVLLVSPWIASAYVTQLAIGMVIVGGIGTIWGPVLGAIILYLVWEYLRFIGPVYNLIVVGLVIMLAVMFMPGGIMGMWQHYLRRNRGTTVTGFNKEVD